MGVYFLPCQLLDKFGRRTYFLLASIWQFKAEYAQKNNVLHTNLNVDRIPKSVGWNGLWVFFKNKQREWSNLDRRCVLFFSPFFPLKEKTRQCRGKDVYINIKRYLNVCIFYVYMKSERYKNGRERIWIRQSSWGGKYMTEKMVFSKFTSKFLVTSHLALARTIVLVMSAN